MGVKWCRGYSERTIDKGVMGGMGLVNRAKLVNRDEKVMGEKKVKRGVDVVKYEGDVMK